MIKNILFDLGGVFIKLTREECVRRFEALGVHDADAMLDPYVQTGLFLDLESGVHTEHSFTDELNRRYKLAITPDDVRHAIHGFVEQVEDFKFDYIEQELPSDINLYLISNTNPFIWGMSTRGLLLDNQRSIDSYFDKCYTSFEMGVCKPDKKIYQQIIADSGITPAETIFIDDGPNNIRVAEELGFQVYCPCNGEDWRPVLKELLKNNHN